jgi:aminoglycoside phosphotransferase (APT) family kinase protein
LRNELKNRVADGLVAVGEAFGSGNWQWRVLGESAAGPNVFEFSRLDRRVIGKFYTGHRGDRDHLALSKLAQVDFEFLSVPASIVYDPARQMMLSEAAQGRPLDVKNIQSDAEGFQRIGRALRELHGSGVDFGPPKRFRDHQIELIDPPPEQLASMFRDHAAAIERTCDQIAAHDRNAEDIPSVPIHRDFHLRQLFDGGHKICVVDWDLCAQGDPAFDVAYFLTYLKTHFREAIALKAGESFVAGYAPTEEVRARLGLYENFNYVRRACRRLRLRDPGWESEIQWMMRRLHDRLLD